MSTNLESIQSLRHAIEHTRLTLATSRSLSGTAAATRAMRILDDHVIPRLTSLDAPLLAVIGGSTGSGKSTLLNTMVRQNLSASSVVRPTTRHPVLVHRPEDKQWFMSTTILPSLARMHREGEPATHTPGEPAHLELRSTTEIPAHLALLDAPDVDSVVEENRDLARQMLDAADMWIFVTTAARYADAVPWQVLGPAAQRGVMVALVLNRVPEGAVEAVQADLRRLMAAEGLADAPLFVIEEHPLTNNRLDVADTAELERWLRTHAESAETRAEVAQQAVAASLEQVLESVALLQDAFALQRELWLGALESVNKATERAVERLRVTTADGSLLRGEVMSRWQEIVGTADFTRMITTTVSSIRDRFTSFVTGKPTPVQPVEDALEAGLATLIEDELLTMLHEIEQTWREQAGLKALLSSREKNPDIQAIALSTTQEWQRDLLEMVRTAGATKRTSARVMAIGVNVVAAALMIAIFASTGGVTGIELGVAGASAAVSHKLLEALFGDQAVRNMTRQAQEDLITRLTEAAQQVSAPLLTVLDSVAVDEVVTDLNGRQYTLDAVVKEVKSR